MQLAGTVIGQYYPGDSIFHRADPRTKIAAAFAFVIVLFMVGSFAGLALMGAALAAGIAVSRLPLSWIYRTARPVFWLVVFTVAFQIFLRGGEELLRLGPLPVYKQGIYDGGFLGARLVLLVLSSTLLTFTTPSVLLADGLAWYLSPLARLRLPAYELSLMVTIALRFIPTLLMELDSIIKAQRARGADIGRGGPVKKAQAVLPVLMPLFVLSFRHADELADAMESRCWRGGRGRTARRKLSFHARDLALAVMIILVLGLSLTLGRIAL